MVERIDAHHHFWRYTPAEYGWIDARMSQLRRDFLPADLEKEIKAAGIDGVVTVQARTTVQETDWLLGMAEQHAFMRGVVGWVPLTEPGAAGILDKYAGRKKLKGIRHVLQGEKDPNYMLRKDFQAGIEAVHKAGLVYDILIFERQLPQTLQFVDRNPKQVFVLDHIAKPRIKEHLMSPWTENIRKLAQRPNVYCKISGMVTEADYHKWAENDLRPYFDVVISAFGPKRLMFGSDWPVCLLAGSYQRVKQVIEDYLNGHSEDEKEKIFGDNAIGFYGLKTVRHGFAA